MVQGVQDLELLQKLQVGVVVHAADARVIFLNDRACDLMGLSKRDILGTLDLMPGWSLQDEKGRWLSPEEYPVNRVISTRLPLAEQVLGVVRPGIEGVAWAMVSAFPVFDAQGVLEKIVISFYDVSQLKRTEAVLKERAEQLRFVLEGADLGLWDWNILTGEVMRNERWATMLGYTYEQIEHTTMQWSDFVHPDVDAFKRINDRYGHHVGDAVLRKLADGCHSALRSLDVFGRLGGEEFAILLPETGLAAAAEVAERLRLLLADAQVPIEGGQVVRFTVSIGVASMSSPEDSIDTLLNTADRALYAAKHAGRNRVHTLSS